MPVATMPPDLAPAEWPDAAAMHALLATARAAAAHARIALQHRTWQGPVGNWAGAGSGSSIDFQDHRPYLPGDDPRYIDWAAYARSGHYIMKLYREEVSPSIDLLLDGSRSMTHTIAKRDTLLTLAAFITESALALGATLRVWAVAGPHTAPLPLADLVQGRWVRPPLPQAHGAPEWSLAPLQTGSLRVVVSDLLYDRAPADLLRPLLSGRGRAALLVPYTAAEAEPDWDGNLAFLDCETAVRRRQRFTPSLLARYRAAYRRHTAQWREAARRFDVRMARVPCEPSFSQALRAEAFAQGVLEPWT